MKTKICFGCKQEKDIDEFTPSKKNTDGYYGSCKDCRAKYQREYRRRDLEKSRAYNRMRNKTESTINSQNKYRKSEKAKKAQERYRSKPEYKQKTHERTTSLEYRARVNKQRWDNIEESRRKERERGRKEREKPEYKLKHSLKARFGSMVKRCRDSRNTRTVALIGCSLVFLREYIESLWYDNMNWTNYGMGKDKWVIDHIIPCDAFDPKNKIHRFVCFYYKNLRPLWWIDNELKGAKYLQEDFDNYMDWFIKNVYNK